MAGALIYVKVGDRPGRSVTMDHFPTPYAAARVSPAIRDIPGELTWIKTARPVDPHTAAFAADALRNGGGLWP